jgi:hypothetical protein
VRRYDLDHMCLCAAANQAKKNLGLHASQRECRVSILVGSRRRRTNISPLSLSLSLSLSVSLYLSLSLSFSVSLSLSLSLYLAPPFLARVPKRNGRH